MPSGASGRKARNGTAGFCKMISYEPGFLGSKPR